MLTTRPVQCVPGQVQDSGRAAVSVSVLTPALTQVGSSKHVHIRCFQSSDAALVPPCTPMPVVSTVSQCLVHHVLHGICPNVMTFREPTRSGGFLDQGGKGKQGDEREGMSTLLGDNRAHS